MSKQDHNSNCQSDEAVSYPSLSLNIETKDGTKNISIDDNNGTKITVLKNGKSQFAIWIRADGSISISDYAPMIFKQQINQNYNLEPVYPWREDCNKEISKEEELSDEEKREEYFAAIENAKAEEQWENEQ